MRTSSTLLLLLSLGCSASLGGPEDATPLPVTRFKNDQASYVYVSQMRQPQRLVIRDNAAWTAAWSSLWTTTGSIPAPPQVDFTREMVVLAALGERSSGGFGITIDSAKSTASGVTVFVTPTSPGPRCMTTAALTQPVDIARLPRVDTAVRFQDVAKVQDCQ
jgi:hypothetical protein